MTSTPPDPWITAFRSVSNMGDNVKYHIVDQEEPNEDNEIDTQEQAPKQKKKKSKSIKLVFACVNFVLKLVGWVLSTLALCFIMLAVYVYLSEFYPLLALEQGEWTANCLTLVGAWIVINLLFNFFSTTWIGPGINIYIYILCMCMCMRVIFLSPSNVYSSIFT